MHENWTFKNRQHKGSPLARLMKFNSSSVLSPIIQVVSIQIFFHVLHLSEQIGLAVGVIIGLFVNYAINILWIWKASPEKVK